MEREGVEAMERGTSRAGEGGTREGIPDLSPPKYYAHAFINFPSPHRPRHYPDIPDLPSVIPLSGPLPADPWQEQPAPDPRSAPGKQCCYELTDLTRLEPTPPVSHSQSLLPPQYPPLLHPPCIPLEAPQSVPNAQSPSTLQSRSVVSALSSQPLAHATFG